MILVCFVKDKVPSEKPVWRGRSNESTWI